MHQPLTVAVVTGGHSFDVPGFHRLWRSMAPGIDATIMHLDDWCTSPPATRQTYDVVVFFTFMPGAPVDDGPWYSGPQRSVLGELGTTPQGIVVWHHALLGHPDWPFWSELCGLGDRSFGYHGGETVTSRIADATHPITAGLEPWTMVDETYTTADAGPGNQILITYDHPRSMKTIAWARTFRLARVFCYQAGHDDLTWSSPGFRELLARGVRWTAP